MAVQTRLADVLLGSIVTLLTVPLGIGPAVGGWLAGRGTDGPVRGAVAGTIAGAVGTLPWVTLVYLASAGAIDDIGYHEGWVHVGVNAAAPETFVLWQELLLTALVAGCLLGMALVGGVVAGLTPAVVGAVRTEASETLR